MALFRKLFYRKPPDGLLEISERVYVFDCCFTTDTWQVEDYKVYIGGIVGQLKEHFPGTSILVFNFRDEESPSRMGKILQDYDMTIMDYPRHYESCPLLRMEVTHHFLRSCESWLSLGQQNVLLMHCEQGGWPVLAFMLSALLIYRKQYSGEQKTLDMVYKQAPHELLQLWCPLNPIPSQLRYLQYVSRRNVTPVWPPSDRALNLDCLILRVIPNFDGEGGCLPIFRIYGQDPLLNEDTTPRMLYSTPRKGKALRTYKQVECELAKIDISCHVQGDVVLECISLVGNMECEVMMFRVMFNTAFIRSNILMLSRDEIDMMWDAKDRFPKDFRAEIIFSEIDAAATVVPVDFVRFEEKGGLPVEAFAKVHEIFNHADWSNPKAEAAMNALQHVGVSSIVHENGVTSGGHQISTLNISPERFIENVTVVGNSTKISLPSTQDSSLRRTSADVDHHENSDILHNQSVSQPPDHADVKGQPTHQLPQQPTTVDADSTETSHVSVLHEDKEKSVPDTEHHLHTPLLSTNEVMTNLGTSVPDELLDVKINQASPAKPSQLPESLNGNAKKFHPSPPLSPSASRTSKYEAACPSPVQEAESKRNQLLSAVPVPNPETPLLTDNFKILSSSTPSPPLDPSTVSEIPPSQLPVKEAALEMPDEPSASLASEAATLHSPSTVTLRSNLVDIDKPPSPGPCAISANKSHAQTPPAPPSMPPLGQSASPLSSQCPMDFSSTESSSMSSMRENSGTRYELPPPPPSPPLAPTVSSSTPSPPPLSSENAPGSTSSAPVPPSVPPRNASNVPPAPPPPPPPLSSENAPGLTSSAPVPPPVPPRNASNVPPAPPPPISSRPGPPPPPPPPLSSDNAPGPTSSAPVPPPMPPRNASNVPPAPPPPISSRPGPPPPPPPPLSSENAPVPTNSAPVPPPVPPRNASNVPSAPPPPISSMSNGGSKATTESCNSLAGSSSSGPKGAPAAPKGRLPRILSQKNNQTKKLKPLHWLKITRAVQGSLWAESQKLGDISNSPEIDMSELETLFSAIPNSDGSGRSSMRGSRGPKSDRVQLVEHRRAYNCEIMLSKVKVPLQELMSSVLALEDFALDIDQVENLIKFCPTKEEMDLLKGYTGDKEKLGKCEQFFNELMQVPRVESKLRVFAFKMQFHTQVSDLRNNLNNVKSAAEEIRNSVKFKKIMQTILSLGNALNQGTARGSAIGFRLDSLLKLTDTRARNNKMTLMHYLCKVLSDKMPELLDFSKDLSSLESVAKIQLKFLAEEMQAVSKGLEKVMQELSSSENDGPISEIFCKNLKEFLSHAEAEVRSVASLYSEVGRNVDALIIYFGEDPARCPFEQVISTLLNFMRMFNRAHEENCKQVELELKKSAEREKLKEKEEQQSIAAM